MKVRDVIKLIEEDGWFWVETKGKDEKMRYAIVIEKGTDNYSAYVSDLPGCVFTGATIENIYVRTK